MDKSGNLYGTTGYGGTGDCVLLGTKVGCGTVYEISPPKQKGGSWTETILHSFHGGSDGYLPQGDLVLDPAGSVYGATVYGGGYGTCNAPYYQYCGTIFRLHPPKAKGGEWSEKVLYAFKGGTTGKDDGDGAEPNGGLVVDSTGVVYGTTFYGGNEVGECAGGDTGVGCGTVFKLSPSATMCSSWTRDILFRFNVKDGATPAAGVIFDNSGNLYGTAYAGGDEGNGAIFELAKPSGTHPFWTMKTLHVFSGGSDGDNPLAPLTLGADADLYGTAYAAQSVSGTVFRISAVEKDESWSFSVLYGFPGPPNGAQPAARVVSGGAGRLYSTTQKGGTGTACSFGCGTVFELTP
jgi:uncharacterized repeat protein (TIGR03803 family)